MRANKLKNWKKYMKVYKWKKIGSEVEFDNPRIKIRKDRFVKANGEKVEFCVLERGEIVAVLAITDDSKIVVVEQYRPAVDDITIDIPGGGIEMGETPLEAAKRELKEETGYSANEFIKLSSFYPDSGRSEQKRHIFLAKGLNKGKQKLDRNESINVLEIPIEEVAKRINENALKETTLVLSFLVYCLAYFKQSKT